MAEENQENKVEKKIKKEVAEAEKELAGKIAKIEKKVDDKKISEKKAEKEVKEEVKETVKETSKEVKEVVEKTAEKTEKKKKTEEKKVEKNEAFVNGKDLPVSTKHAVAVCDFIRGRSVERAIIMLGEVLQMKRAVPMKGEIPHRKGKGMERGRYPLKACQEFIKLLKQLIANATVNGIDLEKGRIECKADRAARPYKRFGNKKFKRTHITLKLRKVKK